MEQAQKPASGLAMRCLSALLLAPVALGVIIYGGWPFTVSLSVLFIICMVEWHRMVRAAPRMIVFWIIGYVYFSVSFFSFWLLRQANGGDPVLILALVIGIWAGDSGAYLSGRLIGGPKLAPKTSPKKTWAGFFGSMIFCAAGLGSAMSLSLLFHTEDSVDYHLAQFSVWGRIILIGLVLGAVGQAGDLLMSRFKRRAGLKDSGHLIPGHGGLLDRIDSLLLAAPVFVFILSVLA